MEIFTKASNSDAVTQRETDNLRVAYKAACEAVVLLKNDGTLPLAPGNLALYGPGADMTVKGGSGSGEVNERHSVSILEGLENRGFTVTTHSWLRRYRQTFDREQKAYRAQLRREINLLQPGTIMDAVLSGFFLPDCVDITEKDVSLSDTDCCVYVLSRQAGEGGDRKLEKGDYFLTDGELQNIRLCAGHYTRFILLINSGCSLDLSQVLEIPGVNAILYVGQLGSQGGHAVADILTGEVSPSGKLADTWAKRYEDIPFGGEYSHLDGQTREEAYREGIYVGYRYFDSFGVEPAYPFGFGLSYTRFDIQSAGVTVYGGHVTVKATVTNTGDRFPGKEVAQLYVSAPDGALPKEYQSLMDFGKTSRLEPGARQTLTLGFDMEALASYREEDNSFVLEPGEYILRLGNSSRNTVVIGALVLEREVIVSRHMAICPPAEPVDALTPLRRELEPLAPGLPRIHVDDAAFRTKVHSYEVPRICPDPWVHKFMSRLTPEDMAEIVVGVGMFGGDTRFRLPGSVGNTTAKFWDKGLANVALCDGPAGLRLQRRSTISAGGKIKPVDMAMAGYEGLPAVVKKLMKGDPERETVLYQYATAFPVASALAQTWNTPLLHRVGEAVYREMKAYGCTFWLAPAINIHRNPLCGRNFEYFSEDPRLTGLMAAALIQGVQREDGYYVTVKHFACNNQEDSRNYTSANLSQRALREIYLRGFELAIREGGAKSVMTSYNRVNGVYTPNSYDLCTRVLRNEWGFEGVVMTDWFSTGGDKADTALCMKAGNDLIMPGGGSYRRELLKGLKDGRITQEELRRCCANVVKAILDSAIQREYIH